MRSIAGLDEFAFMLQLFVSSLCSGSMFSDMQQQSSADLWRTQLCVHGPDHDMPGCRFAHRLCDLSAPDERVVSYGNRWRDFCVDRFYGQLMSDGQIRRIRNYYAATPACDRPLWAHALRVLQQCNEGHCGYAYPWDFGLVRDYKDLVARRLWPLCPFEVYPNLWVRLGRRREFLVHYPYPTHALLIQDLSPAGSHPSPPIAHAAGAAPSQGAMASQVVGAGACLGGESLECAAIAVSQRTEDEEEEAMPTLDYGTTLPALSAVDTGDGVDPSVAIGVVDALSDRPVASIHPSQVPGFFFSQS